ncbi:MAG: cysteine-rich small domain-containing protein [Clostridia bacterium]|nr:cysteine-rich small domain-containing protein [Clostridia bacterium]
MKDCSKFFKNTNCEYFPCHKTKDTENFNCLFCYCPLYSTGDRCGGNFTYTENGIKDCSECTIVHSPNGYNYVLEKLNLTKE